MQQLHLVGAVGGQGEGMQPFRVIWSGVVENSGEAMILGRVHTCNGGYNTVSRTDRVIGDGTVINWFFFVTGTN